MTRFGATHIILFTVTAAFLALSSFAVAKLPKRWQNAAFILAAAISVSGIFYRYGMGLTPEGGVELKPLLLQMLQVCNFNFILLPLMFIPKLGIARQYAIYFSMFAASTTLVSLGSDWVNYNWYDVYILNSWLNHTFAIACPLWMLASGRVRPERRAIPAVSGCLFGYFTVAYVLSEIFKSHGIMTAEQSFSFIYDPEGAPLLTEVFELIGLPYFYLYPVFVLAVGFFVLFSIPFAKRIDFDLSGGVGRARGRLLSVGEKCHLPAVKIEKSGARLLGWSSDMDAKTPEYLPGAEFVMPSDAVTLYAVWCETLSDNVSDTEKSSSETE